MDPEEKQKHIKAITEQIEIIKETERTLDEAAVQFTKGLEAFHQKKDLILDQRRLLRKQLKELDSPPTEESSNTENSGKQEIDEKTKKEEERVKAILSHNLEKEIPKLIKNIERQIKEYE